MSGRIFKVQRKPAVLRQIRLKNGNDLLAAAPALGLRPASCANRGIEALICGLIEAAQQWKKTAVSYFAAEIQFLILVNHPGSETQGKSTIGLLTVVA